MDFIPIKKSKRALAKAFLFLASLKETLFDPFCVLRRSIRVSLRRLLQRFTHALAAGSAAASPALLFFARLRSIRVAAVLNYLHLFQGNQATFNHLIQDWQKRIQLFF